MAAVVAIHVKLSQVLSEVSNSENRSHRHFAKATADANMILFYTVVYGLGIRQTKVIFVKRTQSVLKSPGLMLHRWYPNQWTATV